MDVLFVRVSVAIDFGDSDVLNGVEIVPKPISQNRLLDALQRAVARP